MQCFRLGSFLLAVVGSLVAPSVNASSSGTLTIDVDGLRNRQGQVCLSIFATSKDFPSNAANAVQSQCLKITDTSLRVTLGQLPSGKYAVAVLHDENSDGKANRNFLGIPKEGFGFSRNPIIRFGPPKFANSAIPVQGSTKNILIQLRYF